MDLERFQNSPIGRLVPISGIQGSTKQSYSYCAFLPNQLPRSLDLKNQTNTLVAEAARQLGNLQGLLQNLPNPELLIRSSIKREAQSTSALEGTYATLESIFEGEFLPEDSLPSDLREIINYINAANKGFDFARNNEITISNLSKLQAMIVYKTQGGQFSPGMVRNGNVMIGDPAKGIADSQFVPPPAGDELLNLYYDWEKWIHSDPEMHPLIMIAAAHYQFETIHPYFDGNGRLGRLITLMQLVAQEILIPPTLNLSAWFNLQPSKYREELRNLSATGNWDSWITFVCEAIIGQSRLEVIRINELLKFSSLLILDLKKRKSRGAVITIAESLIEDPYFTVASAAKKFNVAFSTANNATMKLVELGVLREITGKGYERIFMCPGVLRILEN